MEIKDIFTRAIVAKASDIHLVPGYLPAIRINGELIYLKNFPLLSGENIETLLLPLLTAAQRDLLKNNLEIDFTYQYGENRLRTNFYYTNKGLSGAFRLIPSKILSLKELSMPASLTKIADISQGLVLVTGQTGQGKSSTLAAIINQINQTQKKHIITVEDPIEYIYPPGKSIISQRELHHSTLSWRNALRSALREDPDIIMIGEMRDYETIELVITIAETGHLVFSTLHTASSVESINRIIDVFPADQQAQIRTQLASVLRVTISQKLLSRIDQRSRVPVVEILVNTPAVSSLIRAKQTYMIDNVLQTASADGQVIFEKYLALLYQQGVISKAEAESKAIRPQLFKKLAF